MWKYILGFEHKPTKFLDKVYPFSWKSSRAITYLSDKTLETFLFITYIQANSSMPDSCFFQYHKVSWRNQFTVSWKSAFFLKLKNQFKKNRFEKKNWNQLFFKFKKSVWKNKFKNIKNLNQFSVSFPRESWAWR